VMKVYVELRGKPWCMACIVPRGLGDNMPHRLTLLLARITLLWRGEADR
jgi:hypothetical protein